MSLPQRPVQTNTNNDVLNTRSAMPNKSINSINENSFSMSRVLYSNTINTLNQQTQNDLQYKKFYGEKNRDASVRVIRMSPPKLKATSEVTIPRELDAIT